MYPGLSEITRLRKDSLSFESCLTQGFESQIRIRIRILILGIRILASLAEGVPRPVALAVANQCLRSASTLLQGHMTIESLKESMSITRGITINALLQLDRGQVRPGISDAVRHAIRYAEKM